MEKAPRETFRRRRPSTAEIAWAAGLFEGEGTIVIDARRVRLTVRMTDEDVLTHFRDVVGGHVYGPYQYQQPDGHVRKPFWVWHSDGQDAAAVARLLEPWLGKRRRARIEATGLLGQGVLPFDG
jgi:hypothetical protein